MLIIPKEAKKEIAAIKSFSKILLPNDPRHYVKNIYCTGEGGRLLFTDAKAIFAINTGFNLEKGYYDFAKVNKDYALIHRKELSHNEYPEHKELFSMCSEKIENNYDLFLKESWSTSSSFIKLSHLLSCPGHTHIMDIKYFQMLPDVSYDILIDRKDSHPFATYFKHEKFEAIIMPIVE